RRELEREFRFTHGLAAHVGVRRINFLSVQRVHAPFVARGDFVGNGRIGRNVTVRSFAFSVADFQFVRLDQRWTVDSVPIGQRFIVFGGLIFAAVLEADDRALAEREKVGQEKTIRRLDFVLVVLRLLFV